MDYAELLPSLFELQAGNFYIALAGEPDRTRVLKIIRDYLTPGQRIFIGVVSPIDPRVETPEEIRDRVLEAARYIPVEQLGTTDDCGFSHFAMTLDHARKGVCEDSLTCGGNAAGARNDQRQIKCKLRGKRNEIRSSVLQTASSVLQIRQRAEQEIRRTNEALDQRTKELAQALVIMRATLEPNKMKLGRATACWRNQLNQTRPLSPSTVLSPICHEPLGSSRG